MCNVVEQTSLERIAPGRTHRMDGVPGRPKESRCDNFSLTIPSRLSCRSGWNDERDALGAHQIFYILFCNFFCRGDRY